MKRALLIAVALLIASGVASVFSQPKPSARAADPIFPGAQIPDNVRAIFQRSCADCHSESPRYPWYSYVAPVSFLTQSDINEGRRHMNMTLWDGYTSIRRQRALSEIANQVQDGDMPLPVYLIMHRDARLSDADKKDVFQWTQDERSRLIREDRK